MVTKVPITFTHKGKIYSGLFDYSPEKNDHAYKLYIDNYYKGSFHLMSDGFHFYGNTPGWNEEELAMDFEIYLVSWFS